MEMLHLEQDYKYFQSIWEHKKSGVEHTAQRWDARAADWGDELKDDGPFNKSLNERVQRAADYLRTQGALKPGGQVIDIGCGPGRFVTEFSKTAAHVTGVDISKKMLRLGEAYAQKCGQSNVTFMEGDFGVFDIRALGWEKKFDLVFTSITPAVGTMDDLKKIMRISRGYCFNSCFVRWEDELEYQIGRDVFGRQETAGTNSHGHWFYSLFNLIWLMGYLPITCYHLQEHEKYVDVNEPLASYYAKCFSEDMMSSEEDVKRIYAYLKQKADPEGKVMRKYKRWYGWILWDVRTHMPRLFAGNDNVTL